LASHSSVQELHASTVPNVLHVPSQQVSPPEQGPQLATGWPQLFVVGPHSILWRRQAKASVSGTQGGSVVVVVVVGA